GLALVLAACNSAPSASVGPTATGAATGTPAASGAPGTSGPAGPSGAPGTTAQDPGTIVFTPDSPSCSDGGTFVASIVLSAPAGAAKLTLTYTKVDETGTETPVGHTDLTVPSPASTALTDGPIQMADWCTDALGAGTYHWIVTRPSDGTQLADGLLTIAA
ncbi:MAG TPA: hypothetical protein VMH24_06395, partial [Candidatus Sulfotelmatobacter sp.]|nr:hypothetical protein [Candidatus Sulfotelmatobacter sp.]